MSFSKHALVLLCLGAVGGFVCAPALAQTTQDKPFDAKPFLPPLLPLPPNAQVNPGSIDLMPSPSNPASITNPQTPSPAGGLRITVPMR